MITRRAFVGALAATVAAPRFNARALAQALRADASAGTLPASALATDETYWAEIQRAFDTDRTLINLNNGGVSPTPTHVLESMIRDLRFSNKLPVEHMWRILEPRVESVRRELAREFGCATEEMAITRNASESQETMIFGLDLRRGDEVVLTNQNYPRMITAWEQRARRDGIVIKQISFRVPPPSMDYIVQRFAEAITSRTRVIEVTHITNLTGQIMPVGEIVKLARPRGIHVFVDGAHAFAHFPFSHAELGCDYYGTSLHKWLLAPVGTGFLYVAKDRQKALWPLMAAPAEMDENIRKYEEIGTHPAANHNAIAAALAFHRAIGGARKAERLRYLRDRWARRVVGQEDRAQILTPLDDPRQACGICLVSVPGLEPVKLAAWLMERYKIVTTPIVHAEFGGLRITPNVYTTVDEIDLFADRLLHAVSVGL